MEPKYPGVSAFRDQIRLEFQWKKKKYRPVIPQSPTPTNLAKASKLYLQIKSEIKARIFDYERLVYYFPQYGEDIRENEDRYGTLFGHLAVTFMDVVEVADSTHNAYRKLLNKYWLPALELRPVVDITTAELRKVVAGFEWSSNKNRANAVSLLRRVLELAVDDELIQINPADKLKTPKHQKPEPDPFSEAEARKIIAYMYQKHKYAERVYPAYFEFAFFTGMRTSEMLGLRWDDINWGDNTARVQRTHVHGRQQNHTKTRRIRDVKLTEEAMHALLVMKPLTYMMRKNVFLSPRYQGKAWMTDKPPRERFKEALEELGIRPRPAYNTRHTYATYMLMNNVQPGFAAKQLGHSKEMFFRVYAKWIDDDSASDREMEKLKSSHKIPTIKNSIS